MSYDDIFKSVYPLTFEDMLTVRPIRRATLSNEPIYYADKETSWLDEAKKVTTDDRRKVYGHPLPNFIRIALEWIPIFDMVVTPRQVAQAFVGAKIARDANTYKDDNWIDAIGYSNTVQMMDNRMKELGYPKGIEAFDNIDQKGLAGMLVEILQLHEARYAKGL